MGDNDLTGGRSKLWTPSNVITVTRILLVPVFVGALLAPWPEWFGVGLAHLNNWKSFIAAGIFVIISGTDWLDGYLARSRNEVTDFGKFMDPLADKILVTAALIALVELGSLPTWVVLIIIAREFIVSGVRMMAATEGVVIAASMLGKFKTVFQMIAIVLFTIKDSHMIGSFGTAVTDIFWVVSWLFMLIAVALTIASMIDYLYKARDLIGLGRRDFEAVGGTAEPSGKHGKAQELVAAYTAAGMTCATAESLTGGMIGESITAIPGSSDVFRGGVISYASDVKSALLDVSDGVLAAEGAVCRDVACQMARGARLALGADAAVAVTGIAGPGGAEPGKPVGTVWIAVSTAGCDEAEVFHFDGDRADVRAKTTDKALELLIAAI